MRKSSGIILLIILVMVTTFLGCADLKTIDFSGTMPLTARETTGSEGMVELGDMTIETHWQLNHDLFFRSSSLNEYLAALIWERSYQSHDGVSFAKEIPICDVPYSITTTVNRLGKIYLELAGRSNDNQVLNNLDWNESGDPWWKSFDFRDEEWESESLSHEAVVRNSFNDPKSGQRFVIRSQYRFEVQCNKEYYENNGQKEIDPTQSYLDLKLKVDTMVGYCQYLWGEKTFIDQKGRKATITAVLPDRDLDGHFTEKDSVDVAISNSFYHRDHIPFGKPLKIDSRSSVSYLLHLKQNTAGYDLEIKQTQ